MDKTYVNLFEVFPCFKYTIILPKNTFYDERQLWYFSFDNGYDVAVIQFEEDIIDDIFSLALLRDGVIYNHPELLPDGDIKNIPIDVALVYLEQILELEA